LVGWLPGPLRRQTTIAVVEANDLESPVNEQANEIVSPVSQLAPKAHDEEQWFTIALDVVFDSDPVDFGLRHRWTVVVMDDFLATGPHLRATDALRW